ncbi:ABC transporter permease [Mycoplasmatota bacterium WC44]
MNVILKLVKRNVLNYLYDKSSIFFSFLSVLIIIFLYVAFLGNMHVESIVDLVGDIPGIRWMIDSWIIAGIITVNSITVPLSILSDMIYDIEHKTINDFLTAPISRGQIVIGYLGASWLIGIVLSLFTLCLGQIYIVANGGDLISFITFIKAFLIIVLSVVTFSSFSFLLLSFVKSINTVGVVNTLVGTLIGFLAGIYVPLGAFGPGLQTAIKLNPAAHVVSIFRKIFMEVPLDKVFMGAPVEASQRYRNYNGVDLNIFDIDLSITMMVLYLITLSVIFFGLSVVRLNKMKR